MAINPILQTMNLVVEHYKCFGSEAQGFHGFRNINLVIGRNNSGKSALLDLIQLACSRTAISPNLYHLEKSSKIFLTLEMDEQVLRSTFLQSTSGGPINGNHWNYGQQFIGSKVTVELQEKNTSFRDAKLSESVSPQVLKMIENAALRLVNPFEGKKYKRLLADRDIKQETSQPQATITSDGSGLTNTIQRFINNASLPNKLVERDLLHAMNEIFQPDASFLDIRVRQHQSETGPWEIFLDEKEKGRIAISQSGSGIKTVLLVLSFLILVPHLEKASLSQFVFAFEELENNLHPALQRRLIKYLLKTSLKNDCLIFLTTHSSAVIDLLSREDKAQIIHVTHSGTSARAKNVTTYIEARGILDDLDVRASDLLQSNCVVWVEGPTDRLYFNRWVSLFTNGKLQEGIHYQCVFYGGRLLAHLSAVAPFEISDIEEAVKILRVNRNAIVIMDSDKSEEPSTLNMTKQRIISEITSIGGIPWVTQGREIENYLTLHSLRELYTDLKRDIGQYEDMKDFLSEFDPLEGLRFEKNKSLFAERIIPFIKTEDLGNRLDLVAMLSSTTKKIAEWNGLECDWA